MPVEKFPLLSVKGTAREIGFQHGKLIKERIQKTIKAYHLASGMEEEIIFKKAEIFKKAINGFNPDYSEEIEAIAKGSGAHPLWIYALNGRTELMSFMKNECTALYFAKRSILAQNWDWAEALESLAVIMRIKREDGLEILQMTEPGIIGKIGLNNKGVGACLNFLHLNVELKGVPIHVLLRAVLDSYNLEEAVKKMENHEHGTASNILIGNNKGRFIDVEFGDKKIFLIGNSKEEEIFIHTNHYLKNNSLSSLYPEDQDFTNTNARYDRAFKLSQEIREQSVDDMKKILMDKSNKEHPICRRYTRSEEFGLRGGTVCSIIMDLPKLEMHITKGNPTKHDYELIRM